MTRPIAKYAADDTLFDFDCTELLAEGETITSVPEMSASPSFPADPDPNPANLIFGEPVVNVVAITYPDGRVMEIGKGFQVRISAGTSSTDIQLRTYAVLGVFETSDENTLTTKAKLLLLPPAYPAP